MKKILLYIFFITINLFSNFVYAEDKLIFAMDLIRHGDRTPTHVLPNAYYHWKGGLGVLTPLGMHQEFENGVAFRKMYIEKYHLLSEKYDADQMLVFSDTSTRTIISAQCVTYGLYPLGTGPKISGQFALPEGLQPIPIITNLATNRVLLKQADIRKQYNKILQQAVYASPEWLAKQKEYENEFAKLRQITGLPISKLDDLGIIGSNLYIQQSYHIPLPAGITQTQASQLIALSKWLRVQKYKPRAMGELLGNEIVNKMRKYFINATSEKSKLKYVLFSVHDTTILAVMSAMNDPLNELPPYAADLKILLFQNNKNQEYVKMIYKGKTLTMPFCQNRMQCPLDEFLYTKSPK